MAITTYDANKGNALIDSLARQKHKVFLIVGHSNTVPAMLRQLWLQPTMQDIPEDDFDNMFTVRVKWFFGRKIRLEESTYGEVSP